MSLVSRTGRICGFFIAASWVPILGQTVVSCSSASARPAELGDCVRVGDAACTTPDPGGGSGSGPGGNGDSGASDTGSVATGCGTAASLLGSQNTACVPCVEGTGEAGMSDCCMAALACSGQSACTGLLQCIVACASTDTTCQSTCQNNNPNGVQAYDDFAACLSTNCSPECPTLPTGNAIDF
ncbi:MAG TPA: hypothetical protein VGL81_31120 [Polyangiaceae bacterium]